MLFKGLHKQIDKIRNKQRAIHSTAIDTNLRTHAIRNDILKVAEMLESKEQTITITGEHKRGGVKYYTRLQDIRLFLSNRLGISYEYSFTTMCLLLQIDEETLHLYAKGKRSPTAKNKEKINCLYNLVKLNDGK